MKGGKKLFPEFDGVDEDIRRYLDMNYRDNNFGIVPMEIVREAGSNGDRTETYFVICWFVYQREDKTMKRIFDGHRLYANNKGSLNEAIELLQKMFEMFSLFITIPVFEVAKFVYKPDQPVAIKV